MTLHPIGDITQRTREVQASMDGLKAKNLALGNKVDELPKLGEDMAQAERDYNMAYARKLLILQEEGCAVTVQKKLVDGDKHVSELLFKFRVAKVVYDSAKKKSDSLNVNIDTYRSLLSWYKQEYGQTA
jgi:hypothetical protein